jgi:hypothetical protein
MQQLLMFCGFRIASANHPLPHQFFVVALVCLHLRCCSCHCVRPDNILVGFACGCRRARVCCLPHGRCDVICSGIGCIYLQTHATSHGIQPKYLLSQQVTLRRSMSGHELWKQTNKATQKGHILHVKFISGHAQAGPEATFARPSKDAYRCTTKQEIPPNQSNAELPQSTSHKRGPRDTARARSLFS